MPNVVLFLDPIAEGQTFAPGQRFFEDENGERLTMKVVDFDQAIAAIDHELALDKGKPLLSIKQIKLLHRQKANYKGLLKASKAGNVLHAKLWTKQVGATAKQLDHEHGKILKRLEASTAELIALKLRYDSAVRKLKGKGKAE